MDIDTEKIVAQEFDWVFRNEPTFQLQGNTFTGKIGRTPTGDDIRIKLALPEFYPIMRPTIEVLADISHPNINSDKTLALQLLDEWEPVYRLKDVISAARRLFIRSRTSIKSGIKVIPQVDNRFEQEIISLQKQIGEYNDKITEQKMQQLQEAGIHGAAIGPFKISKELDVECHILALNDLVDLIIIKFEDADIDQIDFFRLYRKYIRELFLVTKELQQLKGKNYAKETKRPITN